MDGINIRRETQKYPWEKPFELPGGGSYQATRWLTIVKMGSAYEIVLCRLSWHGGLETGRELRLDESLGTFKEQRAFELFKELKAKLQEGEQI